MSSTNKCLRHSLHNHGCNCPVNHRYSPEQNKIIRSLYTKLKFSSQERKACRNFMYKRTAAIKTAADNEKTFDDIVEFIKSQLKVHNSREGSAEPEDTPKKQPYIRKKRKHVKKSENSEEEEEEDEKKQKEESEDDDEEEEKVEITPVARGKKRRISHANKGSSSNSSNKNKEAPRTPEVQSDPDDDADDNSPDSPSTTTSSAPEVTQRECPSPPQLQEHVSNMFSNKIQCMHMVWILIANKRGIITDGEMDNLQLLPYNNQSPFFILTLFLVLYECLRFDDYEKGRLKWQEDGKILFHELLNMMDRRQKLAQ
ncbi:hypothetical protein AKO1_011547 [Acrasis kona]|uniref:Uncharacterized protein n=1 Tax=Acrasis kona TaxID=1008807 RepID=A0AAW2Z3A9_9EUKA